MFIPSCFRNAVVSRAGCSPWIALISFSFLSGAGGGSVSSETARLRDCETWRERDNVLLGALDDLDQRGDDAYDEAYGAQDLEERAEAAEPGRRRANFFAGLASLCATAT